MDLTSDMVDVLAHARARNLLIRTVRDQLKGKGLDIRELEKELAISNPGHPENGRIYITLATGDVSHRRTVWDYLGYFIGSGTDRDPDEPGVDLNTIVSALTGPPGDSQ